MGELKISEEIVRKDLPIGNTARIAVRDLHIYVGSRRQPEILLECVRGVSIEIGVGQIHALVGESGSGKSLTAKAIMALLDKEFIVKASAIQVAGKDIISMPEKELNRIRGKSISFIAQDPMSALNPVLTVGTQLRQVISAHLTHDKAEQERIALSILTEVGIRNSAEVVRRYPHELSGGMRQRVLIGMALSCSPAALIADEATTALDVTLQEQVLDLFSRMRDERGMSILLITHDLGVVSNVADSVSVMYAGQIVEYGPTRVVLERPRHPYTEALLKSVPKIGKQGMLETISGVPVQPGEIKKGCAFAPRCPIAIEICHQEQPASVEDELGRGASCWIRSGSSNIAAAKPRSV